jgi:protease-4
MSISSTILRVVTAIWRGLDRIRKVLHFALLATIFIVLLAVLVPDQPVVPGSAALILAPQGVLVDQLSGDPFDRVLAQAQGIAVAETLLQDLLDALRAAQEDARIKAVVLQLDGLTGAGLSKLQELAAALHSFKESGKPVIALGSGFDQNQYFVAAQADQVYMHPMGLVLLEGYSRYLPYYKSALDKLYIDYNVWTVGEYKSFVEPVTRDDMSPEDREASQAYLDALWGHYQADVAVARELPPDGLQRYADDFVELLRGAGGDTAALAESYGLVDELLTQDRMRARVRDIVGADRDNPDEFAGIDHNAYLTARRQSRLPGARGSKIGVIVASGTILDGMQPAGVVGGDSTALLIREAAGDEQVEALVLRVDSPGGSAFASDVILRELEVFRESGRPVVVSMGSVAASGGYWISLAADEIWASPTTLTGSIGVGATLPTFQRMLDRIGVHVDGVGTTGLSGQYDLTRALGDDFREVIGESVRHTYDEFLAKVAASRDRSVAEIDAVARGRVWIGSDAQSRGLVDELGGLDDAIESAAGLAGLGPDSYDIEYLEPELGLAAQLLLDLGAALAPLIAGLGVEPGSPPAFAKLIAAANEPLAFLEHMNDPRGIYAYCFCDVR